MSLYPKVDSSNPSSDSPFTTNTKPSSSSSLYPTINADHIAENLFADDDSVSHTQNPEPPHSSEDILITVPNVILHLIEKDSSLHLASGDLSIVTLSQNNNIVAALARIGDQIQWPLAKDEAAVKLDESHYFFTLRVPSGDKNGGFDLLNYGLTVVGEGKEGVLKEFDGVLEKYSWFSKEKVEGMPEEMKWLGEKKEESCAAYWTTIAPNVEDYSGSLARWIAAGSGQVVRGILWCGDVTVDRLKWGNDYLKKRIAKGDQVDMSPEAMRRMKRVKRLTKMSENVAIGVLSGVVKVSGFFTSSVVNSKAGKKFFSLLPGEIILASLDGFNKVCDAVEVAGKNVMSTSSVVTTGLVSHKYGEEAAKVTNEGLGAAGHAIGTAWAVFKIRKALNPKSVLKPSTIAKAAAQEMKSKSKNKS